MISFDYTFHSSDPTHWLVAVLLGVVFVGMLGLVWRNTTLSPRRKGIRAGLNLILWLLLVAYALRPVWKTPADTPQALLVGQEVPAELAQKIQDSLGLEERFGSEEFVQKKLATHFDSVTLLGQHFSPEVMAQLSSVALGWIPYHVPDQLQTLHWRPIVQQGEIQQVTGQLHSSKKQWLKLSYAGKTLDSTLLTNGTQPFTLRFPAFAEGRTSTALYLEDQLLDSVRFFTHPLPLLSYQFILGSPDFESRTLTEWLGQKGNRVTVSTTVSRGIQSSTTINEGVAPGTLPDVIITDPAHANHTMVKKGLAAGKSVVFINLTQPDEELTAVNRALGTAFSVRRISTENTISISTLLTALPYAFTESLPQVITPGYPVATWNKGAKIGVSLLSETFPLKLSGDSIAYARLWNTVLAQIQPPLAVNLTASGPIFKGISGQMYVNATAQLPSYLRLGEDSLALLPTPLNAHSAEANYRFGHAGWIALTDSAEVFVHDSTSALYPTVLTTEYLRALGRARYTSTSQNNKPSREAKLPDWAWLVLFILACTALWVEPKLQ